MGDDKPKTIKGRGAQTRPPNRFEAVHVELDPQARLESELSGETPADVQAVAAGIDHKVETLYLPDNTQTIIAENDSPDVGFRYSVNPYRGCEHGCAYCYARPTHEYLGFDAGLDFETRIMVKHRAAALLREALARSSWKGELIAFSGNTDCYQPVERKLELTRQCLQVALECRQAVGIITKNALILRDLDVLAEMARLRLAHVNISVTTLDAGLARTMEPRTPTPEARLAAIARLTAAGVPVRALVAPVIPGLNDDELPAILKAVREAGAQAAGYVLLRLPLAVEPVFRDWLAKSLPLKQARVEGLVKSTREGTFYKSQFGSRMAGKGQYAEQIAATFRVFAKKHALDGPLTPALDFSQFRRPTPTSGQKQLF